MGVHILVNYYTSQLMIYALPLRKANEGIKMSE